MSNISDEIRLKLQKIADREHKYHTTNYDGVVEVTDKDVQAIINLIEREREKARIDEVQSWLDDAQAITKYKHTETTKDGMVLTPTISEFYFSEQSLKDRLAQLKKGKE